MVYTWTVKTPDGVRPLQCQLERSLESKFILWHQRTYKPWWLEALDKAIAENRCSKH